MSRVLDASAIADVNPYELPAGWFDRKSSMKIQSGSIRATYADEGFSVVTIADPAASGVLTATTAVVQGSNVYSDTSGPLFIDEDGDGYYVEISGGTIAIRAVTAFVIATGGGLATLGSQTWAAGASFTAKFNIVAGAGNSSLDVYIDSVMPEAIALTATGLTHTGGMAQGFGVAWGNNNSAGVNSVTVDGFAASNLALVFSGLADVNPYVDPDGWSTATGGFKIESGALAATAVNSNLVYDDVDLPQTGLTIQGVLKENSVPFVYRGLKFFKTNGAGYFAQLYSTEFSLWKQADFNGYELLGGKTYSAYDAGAGIRFEYAANEAGTEVVIAVYLNDVMILTYTDSASPIIEDGTNGPLRPALSIYNNNGLGFTSALVGGGGVPEEPEEPSFAINQLVAGSTSTITFSEAYTPTSLIISDGAGGTVTVTSFTGSGASWGFTCPDLLDETVGPMLGDVSVVITDGVTPLDSIIGVYSKTNYTGVILTSIATGNVGKGFSPALEVGNQEAYDPTKGSIGADGIFDGTVELFTGTQTAWDHNASDRKWRSYSIRTYEGDIIPDGTIDSLASLIYQGVSTPFQTTGIDSPITSITFGDVAMAFAESGGDGSLTAPAWYSGLIQPLDHEQDYSVYITDGVTSASALRQYGVPAGLEHRTVPGTVNTGNDSLYQYSTFQPGFDAYIPDLGAGSIDDDGTFVDLVPGTYPGFWSRDLSYEMHQFTLVYAPTTPAVFKFIDINNATASTTYTSNTVTISALVESVPVTIVGGTYSKNGGPFITAEGTADNGDEFRVRLVTGANPSDSFNSTLTVGTRSDTYTVNMPDANTGGGHLGVTSRSITAR